MRIYIDKGNIESFVLSAASDPNEFAKCNLMLKKHFDMHLNLSQLDFAQSKLCMEWANTLLDGRGKNQIHLNAPLKVFPPRPINPNTFGDEFDEQQKSAVYLIDDIAAVSVLETKGNYIIGEVGNEIDTLRQLMIGDEDELYTQSLEPLKRYFFAGNWSGLDNSVLPCTDIVITDGYILSNPSLYKTNLIALIKKIATRVTFTTINIVIFCLSSIKDTKGNIYVPVWADIRSMIKNELKAEDIDVTVTFVASDSAKDFEEHDRTICTNYLYYVPGATLNFYDSRGNFTSTGRHFTVHSKAKESYKIESDEFIKDMQSLITGIETKSKNGLIDKDNASILSGFLHFS